MLQLVQLDKQLE
jgi:hypothetical protein